MPPDKFAKSKEGLFSGEWFSDLSIMTSILDEVKFYSGTDRRNLLSKNGLKAPSRDSGSMLYGTTWRGYLTPTRTRTKDEETGLYKTKCYDEYPHLKGIFREFANKHFPDFKWAQVQMNKNYPCPPHRDSTNIGESVLVCCGEYEGGKTAIDKDKVIMKYDPRCEPVKFDGSKYLHWTEPFVGKRYSLVFFNNNVRNK